MSKLDAAGVLDDTLIVWGTEIDSGAAHQHFNMPFLLAGGPNIPIKRGKVASFPISYDNKDGCIPVTGVSPSHNDMLRTVLQAVGLQVPTVGSTKGIDVNNSGSVTLNQGVLTDLLA